MTTIQQHLNMMDSESYCPVCGESKPTEEYYCLDCYLQGEEIVLCGDSPGWEPEPMYPYDILPTYTVGYVADVITWCS